MLDRLQSGDFVPYLNQRFHLYSDTPSRLDIELIDVKELGVAPGEEATRRRPFSMVFCGPKDIHLPQKIYTVEHAEMESLDLFLVPIGPNKQGRLCYEAVFT